MDAYLSRRLPNFAEAVAGASPEAIRSTRSFLTASIFAAMIERKIP
jgi:hypothetical protein